MKYQALLFDLDGTLTASGEGITKSVQYALEKMGRPECGRDLKALEVFVGPPLRRQFMDFCGFSEEEAAKAVEFYRERYNTTGVFENRPYPGIRELLEGLKRRGCLLAVASSKPDGLVRLVLEHFGLASYFNLILGSDINRPHMSKGQVVETVLERLGIQEKREGTVMVGDRFYDVEGAREAGLSCIGVTYGYGNREELEKAGASDIAESVEELGRKLGIQGGEDDEAI